MSKGRANSSPDLSPLTTNMDSSDSSLVLQGLAANVKLLLKLIEDHNEACTKDYDGRKMQRVASMITILDEVKSRIQKSQSLVNQRRNASLRRCNTELRANRAPLGDRRLFLGESSIITSNDEKEVLRKELSACMTTRKCLERMFSGLGKEKEIMASELAHKVHQLNGIEEHVNDLKAQNELLLVKVQACATDHRMKQSTVRDHTFTQEDNEVLEDRNKMLSENLLKSLDGYRALKRRLHEAQEEKEGFQEQMVEMAELAAIGLNHVVCLHRRIAKCNEQPFKIEVELSTLEDILQSFENPILSVDGAPTK